MDPFLKKVHDRPINGRYLLAKKIGGGGHGVVYLAKDTISNEDVALKLEHHSIDPSLLSGEADSYEEFQNVAGFPRVYWYGEHDDFRVMAFELLGPSLEDLFQYCKGKLSLKTTLLVLDQLLKRLEDLHTRHLVHRDLKPGNFLLGTGRKGNLVYLTDFGLVTSYGAGASYVAQHQSTGVESEPRSWLVGTESFASIRGHKSQVQFPSDDLESLGYMAIFFLKGRLPWQGLKVDGIKEENRAVAMTKMSTTTSELCAGLPDEFRWYMDMVKELQVGSLPDYEKIRDTFRKLAAREGYDYDDVYDWTIRDYQERAESRL